MLGVFIVIDCPGTSSRLKIVFNRLFILPGYLIMESNQRQMLIQPIAVAFFQPLRGL